MMSAPPPYSSSDRPMKRKPIASLSADSTIPNTNHSQSPTHVTSSQQIGGRPTLSLSPTAVAQTPASKAVVGEKSQGPFLAHHHVGHQAEPLTNTSITQEPLQLDEWHDDWEESPGSIPNEDGVPSTPVQSPGDPPSQASRSGTQAVGGFLKSAYGEARHFAGGLVAHPHESTKHYTILRHSHGLVFYTGSYTSLAISVFGDQDLPPNRTFWLQRKGFSGKAGLGIGASFMGSKSAWIDVTPSVSATADQLKASDERAWQRDIKTFARKAPKKISDHSVRETNVLRIPCEANDGYLRIVMCSGDRGKKSICPSPMFRLASTSTSPSSLRGTSLRTLPLEAAMTFGQYAGKKATTVMVGPYVNTAKSVVTDQLGSVYQPSWALQTAASTAASTAFDESGVSKKLDSVNKQYVSTYSDAYVPNAAYTETHASSTHPLVLGHETGPEAPYPVQFHGVVSLDTNSEASNRTCPVPIATAMLRSLSDSDILLRHSGIYFGYVSVTLPAKSKASLELDEDWHEAIVTFTSRTDTRARVVQHKVVQVHIIEEMDSTMLDNLKLNIMMMGFLRPVPEPVLGQNLDIETERDLWYNDIATTQASLSRSAWQADAILERVRSEKSNRSLTERYVDARQDVQGKFDKVPSHKLGIRTDGMGMRDRLVGKGGICIRR